MYFSFMKSGDIPDWVFLNIKFGNVAPNILAIMDLLLSLSPSSAEAERGFSHLKLIKTNIRSKVGHGLLNHSLVIKLESSDVKNFDPQQSIMHWNTSGVRARRPMSKPLGFRINSGNAEEVETSNPIEIEAQAEMEHSDKCV